MASGERVRLFQPSQVADPYSVYARLRASEPVYWDPASQSWALLAYADVAAALHDPRLASGRAAGMQQQAGQPGLEPFFAFLGRMMPVTDPPQHTRLRGLVNKAFTPHAVDTLAPFIQQLVDELLDQVQDKGEMDVIADFAFPLPAAVICQMLGVPREDVPRVKQFSDDIFLFIKGALAETPAEVFERSRQAAADFTDYLRPLVAARRQQPCPDLLGRLLAVEDGGSRLSDEEVFANAILMLQAGHESTTNLIGNGTLALLRHPDQLDKLRNDHTLVPAAVEEFLRYEAPIHHVQRQVREDLTLGGQSLQKGQMVSLMLGAANRDPAQFLDPDRLDITRTPNKHISFGLSHHFCLGAPLVRLEGRIAIAALLRRFSKLELVGDVAYQENFNLRGLKALRVRFAC